VQPELPRRLDPVQHGHLGVHEHDVGIPLCGERHSLVTVRRRADELDVGERRESC
jgi:hypothetical protein